MNIIGAGLSGLIAANLFPNAQVFEAGPADQVNHKAVLRFRTPDVGAAVRIPFRAVTVRKGIWDNGFQQPSIEHANNYSLKVTGKLLDRSIWNLESVTRYIAPENFVQLLANHAGSRVHWNHPIKDVRAIEGPVISTIPLPVLAKMFNADAPRFSSSPIKVRRWRIPGADVFQTIYFPCPDYALYRASITGDLLIAEYIDDPEFLSASPNPYHAFGVEKIHVNELDSTSQRYGKVEQLSGYEEQWRRAFIRNLSTEHGIYSLGRFATWRNILLDDVLRDIDVIKSLITSDTYGVVRHGAQV